MTNERGESLNDLIKQNAVDICNFLKDQKAYDIIAIDIADKSIIADYMIICSGRSNIQIKSISDDLEHFCNTNLNMDLRRIEGYPQGRWIVLDYADILVHIFHPEEREYYDVERLWKGEDNFFFADNK